MIPVTLVSGASARQREAAIAKALTALPASMQVALLLEGLPSPEAPLINGARLSIARIAPGCPCCIGNLAMRVTLNRILRHPPGHLFLALASSAHREQVRQFLAATPYDTHLMLTPDIDCALAPATATP
ncbi:GTPase [Actimicrobium antarcticum]|uniref:GTPase n=1 Tax=Actimicrobium antarcticum TaxID=1051899 RepID=A0ABP7T5L4_9BURK